MTGPRVVLLAALVLLAAYVWGNYQPEAAGLVPLPWDKLAHALWFAILAGLLVFGLGRGVWPWVLAGTLLFAGWDEWHQFALPGRSPGVDDWLADAFGVVTGILITHKIGRRFGVAGPAGVMERRR